MFSCLSDLKEIVDALPFAISWASVPDAVIQYSNQAFKKFLGFPDNHFRTVHELVEASFINKDQRKFIRKYWETFAADQASGITEVPELEVDILCGDGQIRTAIMSGMILHKQKLALAFYRDVSRYRNEAEVLKKFAYHDPLTGLFNRRGLSELWQKKFGSGANRRAAFLMVDLDEFKPVNDTYGHEAGDALLCVIANRLRSAIRETDCVCRLGGDEFGILVDTPKDIQSLEALCERLVAVLSAPMKVAGKTVSVKASVGGCLYPDQAINKQQLLRRADEALYKVKRTHKGGWNWFIERTK